MAPLIYKYTVLEKLEKHILDFKYNNHKLKI